MMEAGTNSLDDAIHSARKQLMTTSVVTGAAAAER